MAKWYAVWLMLVPWSAATAQVIDTLIQSTTRVRVTSPEARQRESIGRLIQRRGDTVLFRRIGYNNATPIAISGITLLERSGGTGGPLKGAGRGLLVGSGIGLATGAGLGLLASVGGGDCAWFCPSTLEAVILFGGFFGVIGGTIGTFVGLVSGSQERWIAVPIGEGHGLAWSIHPGVQPAIVVRLR